MQARAMRAGFDMRLLARNAGLAALGMIVVSGWWFARNQILYHDVLVDRLENGQAVETWVWSEKPYEFDEAMS